MYLAHLGHTWVVTHPVQPDVCPRELSSHVSAVVSVTTSDLVGIFKQKFSECEKVGRQQVEKKRLRRCTYSSVNTSLDSLVLLSRCLMRISLRLCLSRNSLLKFEYVSLFFKFKSENSPHAFSRWS